MHRGPGISRPGLLGRLWSIMEALTKGIFTKGQLMLYFVEGRPPVSKITDSILPGRFPAGQIAYRQTIRGPVELGAGMLVSRRGDRLELVPEQQTWHVSSDNSFAFGWWNHEKPAPDFFVKPETIPGEIVDGWLIPRVRKQHLVDDSIVYSNVLPAKPRWNGQRFVSGDVCERFRYVLPLAEEAFAMCNAAYDQGILVSAAAGLVSQILQVNHAIGNDELAAIEAFEFSLASVLKFLTVFCSHDHYLELIKEVAEKKTLGFEASESESTLETV